jgi:hypothetical protein
LAVAVGSWQLQLAVGSWHGGGSWQLAVGGWQLALAVGKIKSLWDFSFF